MLGEKLVQRDNISAWPTYDEKFIKEKSILLFRLMVKSIAYAELGQVKKRYLMSV